LNVPNQSKFWQSALASGLLSEQQLAEARSGVRWAVGDEPEVDAPPTDEQLANRLVETGQLNRWQAQQLLEGRTKFNLGPYWIVDSIGQGGMGQVFKAEHSVLGRDVAIKVLPRSKSTPEAEASFTREIRTLASLDHPRLVRALDAGHDGNVYFLVCEYVPGADLRKFVRRGGPLSMQAAARIVSHVAEGLDYAHRKGLIHRDVKPGNVLVSPDGEAKLSDLGLAGPLEADAENDPRYGKIVGTADYVSPDHIESPWDPTPAWDIYSLGCTLYYAVTGKVPFPGGSTADKARAHRELRPLHPRQLNRRLSDEFIDVMADMMAKNPAERITSAAEVISRLARWANEAIPITEEELSEQRREAPSRAPAPPPIVVPPPPPRTASSPRRQPPVVVADDSYELSNLPQPAPEDDDSSSVVLQTTDPIQSAGAETSPALVPTSAAGGSGEHLFWRWLLLPAGIVVAAVLIWLVASLLS
jgi:serine/threonine protein kinase